MCPACGEAYRDFTWAFPARGRALPRMLHEYGPRCPECWAKLLEVEVVELGVMEVNGERDTR